ncbi:MAG: lipoprotein [Gammaproteobacteria bacterium]|nr:lipoprotein [Gammaproteobacteria bacterium]NIR83314.1 lipoprotein [Gammaproteobacteria bacterium]NIR91114.1 lipoprotein [Gammaproteobacteria bacterium]NIU04481.1 lipoprotein [Gammaproteobacteria bacterium]NIW87117.1 hypothetical protein [Gammaproteobacteria bacterium]
MTPPIIRRRFLALALIFCSAGVLLGACGQKGPLYLPEEGEEAGEDEERRESARESRPATG